MEEGTVQEPFTGLGARRRGPPAAALRQGQASLGLPGLQALPGSRRPARGSGCQGGHPAAQRSPCRGQSTSRIARPLVERQGLGLHRPPW